MTGSNSVFSYTLNYILCYFAEFKKCYLTTWDQESSSLLICELLSGKSREKPFYIVFKREKFYELILSKQKQSQRKKKVRKRICTASIIIVQLGVFTFCLPVAYMSTLCRFTTLVAIIGKNCPFLQ